MIRLEMKNYNMMITEKQPKFIKAKVKSSGKIHKYEYLTGQEILPSNQQQIIEQARFTYSSFGKAFERRKQLKIKDKNKLRR